MSIIKGVKHHIFILSFFLFILNLAAPTWSANWYVSNDGAGARNGTSINNAWSQNSIPWSKMGAGDTLHIIGVLHGLIVFNVQTSGAAGNYFTMAGYDSNSGIVLGFEYPYAVWTGPDSYGAYKLHYSNVCHGLYEWITAKGPLNYKKLNNT